MYFKITAVLIVLLHFVIQVELNESANYIGCYKFVTKPTGCLLHSKEDQMALSNKVTNSLAFSVEWIREQQKDKLWLDIPTTSFVLESLVLAGYVHDKGVCTKMIENTALKIHQLLQDGSELSGGKLALVMIGMRVTCYDVTKFKHQNLIEILLEKMNSFPIDEFNNFYQFSLGVLALYVNGHTVPLKYGQELLDEITKTKIKDTDNMRDTEAMMLIALSAMIAQKGRSEAFLKATKVALKKAEEKIDLIMKKGELSNIVTIAHLVQVLQTMKRTKHSEKPYCRKTLEWILGQQERSGSFGGLMTTATLLPMLSENSILDLNGFKCPIAKDDVDENKIGDFIMSRRGAGITVAPTRSKSKISVSVRLQSNIDGVRFVNGRRVTINLAKGSTALDALKQASAIDPCFHFRAKSTAWGPFVEMICKVEQSLKKKTYWMFYVNGKMAQVGPGGYKVQAGDVITFRFQTVTL